LVILISLLKLLLVRLRFGFGFGFGLLLGSLRALGGLLGLGLGSFELRFSRPFLCLDKLLRVGDVAVAEVVPTEGLGSRNTALSSCRVFTKTGVFLRVLLLFLGFVAARLVLVRGLSLKMTPNTIHQDTLVSTDLEGLILAELIENSRGAVTEILAVLTESRILNLVSLEHFLGFGSLGNWMREHMFEEVLHATSYEHTD